MLNEYVPYVNFRPVMPAMLLEKSHCNLCYLYATKSTNMLLFGPEKTVHEINCEHNGYQV